MRVQARDQAGTRGRLWSAADPADGGRNPRNVSSKLRLRLYVDLPSGGGRIGLARPLPPASARPVVAILVRTALARRRRWRRVLDLKGEAGARSGTDRRHRCCPGMVRRPAASCRASIPVRVAAWHQPLTRSLSRQMSPRCPRALVPPAPHTARPKHRPPRAPSAPSTACAPRRACTRLPRATTIGARPAADQPARRTNRPSPGCDSTCAPSQICRPRRYVAATRARMRRP